MIHRSQWPYYRHRYGKPTPDGIKNVFSILCANTAESELILNLTVFQLKLTRIMS